MLSFVGRRGLCSWGSTVVHRGAVVPINRSIGLQWRANSDAEDETPFPGDERTAALLEEFGMTEYWKEPLSEYDLQIGDEHTERRVFKGVMKAVAEKKAARDASSWRKVTRQDILKVPGGSDLLAMGTPHLVEAAQGATPGKVRHWDCANMFPISYWREKENREGFVRFLAAELELRVARDWRYVSRAMFHEYGAKLLLDYVAKEARERLLKKEAETKAIESTGAMKGTPIARGYQPSPEFLLLKECLPELITVEPECRGRIHPSYWRDKASLRAFLDRLAEVHGVKTAEDWASVGVVEVRAMGGVGMLSSYGGMLQALQTAYPETYFDILSCRAKVSQGYWAERRHRRAFLEEVARKMGVRKPSDWKNVLGSDIRKYGGGGLLDLFKGSVFALLNDAFPEQEMEEGTVRRSVPRGYWKKKENREKFLKELAKSLDIRSDKDWQRVTSGQIKAMGGTGLLYRYKDSVSALLEDTLDEVDHDVCRPRVTPSHWDSKEACVRFLDRVKEEFNITCMSDWARVTNDNIRIAGGYGLIVKYGSLFKALDEVYRDHLGPEDCDILVPILRPRVKSAFWMNPDNVVSFTRYLEGALQIKQPEDWFRVSTAELAACRAGGMLRAVPLVSALRLSYPDVKWEELQTNAPKKSSQRLLRQVIYDIFTCSNSPVSNESAHA